MRLSRITPLSLAIAPLLLLAACEQEPVTVEPDVEDLSGGEIIAEPVDPDAVPVDLPETPMTNVPVDSASASPAPEPTPE